ncbi:hypothetical protein RSPO_c03301 [Ralstonia solanacearum Po82]|uniref:Uncharacterized protein n=1 Tax=Ralstonia solanacearum (strain Po82) TaxID=1031711 RepID=F6G4J5_RALS8|nr:hypothetical protein RSPO_c03301 [Ralstonia solanacearum Po82]
MNPVFSSRGTPSRRITCNGCTDARTSHGAAMRSDPAAALPGNVSRALVVAGGPARIARALTCRSRAARRRLTPRNL